MKKKIRVIELFAGIGAPRKALMRGGYNFEIVDAIEIDKYAVKSYNAMYGENIEIKNICEYFPKKEDVGEIDLLFHGSPCQDFSLAGKQAGGDKDSGTRSSLMYETIRIVEKLKPKYVIWENVKNLLSKKHRHNFDAYLETMESLGYVNYYQVLNAKDYGIPQNRERVFTISIRKDINIEFVFPEKQPLKLKLKDMLEKNVDEKYYLSDEMVDKIRYSEFAQERSRIQEKDYSDTSLARDYKDPKCVEVFRKYGVFDTDKSKHQAGSVYDSNGISPTLDTMQGGYRQPCIEIKNNTKKGYLEAHDGDGINISSRMKYQRGNVQKNTIQTLTTVQDKGVVVKNLKQKLCNQLIETNQVSEGDVIKHSYTQQILDGKKKCVEKSAGIMITLTTRGDCVGTVVKDKSNNLRIRKLTPLEVWRLMGFDDEDFEKASKVNSNAQLYKQAGNSIVVNVLEAIFENLLKDYK